MVSQTKAKNHLSTPPKSEFPDSHIRISTKNKLDNVLFYTNGTRHPNGDYSHLTEYKIYVKENPNNSSSSKLHDKGTTPKKLLNIYLKIK